MKLLNFNGVNVLDSRDVAKMIGKKHKNLIRDIGKYIKDFEPSSNVSPADFFIKSNYRDKNNQIRPCYLITQQGCEFVANKLTGKKGNQFTAKYVSIFHQMKKQIAFRKPDSYMIDDPVKRARRWIEERKAYEKTLPKAKYYDSQMRNPGLMTTTEIAKDFGMSATALNKILHDQHVIYPMGSGKKRKWVIYQKYATKGYTQYEPFAYKKDNVQGLKNNLKWTQKGRKFIYDLLAGLGIHPTIEQLSLDM